MFVRSGGILTVQNTAGHDAVSGGSVAFGTGSNNGAAAGTGLFLMSGSVSVFDIAVSYTISDDIADDSESSLPAGNSYVPGNGAGAAIAKHGNGVLVFSGANTYAGATNIGAGIVRVESPGTIQNSATTVAEAGTLTGNGTAGSVDSFGTIAPGTTANPQSALQAASLHLHAGALTCFHADAINATSSMNVAGSATLSGIVRIDFSGSPSVGAMYLPLSANSVSGSFAGYETNMPNLLGHFTYGATSVTFTVDVSDVVFRNGMEQPINDSPCIAAFAN
ncbi:MAG TPA: autotransporter-associated beta strand repeat-containing protein [Rudaea sp.]|nr:autotransporter-associated beta strand repeat-containing protein [Rudaea sp.]